jgi:hypothetical protein
MTMTIETAQRLVLIITIYLGAGGAFAAVFVWRWIGRLDPAAEQGSWGFRALIFPGVAMFWPFFAVRVIRR